MGNQMDILTPELYGDAFARILFAEQPYPLGPGTPDEEMREDLDGLTVETAFRERHVTDPHMAIACVAAVWLYHDFLWEAHDFLQKVPTPTGSYWHAVMHRREPDGDHAKQWFERVGDHPAYEPLQRAVAKAAARYDSAPETESLTTQSGWYPARFADLVTAVLRGANEHADLCQEVQRIEFAVMFNYAYSAAAANDH